MMNLNYRQSGDWQAAMIKVRKNGQWVPIGDGFSEEVSQDEFNWINPPERSTTEYTSDYSSIQNALNSISSETELVIDDGPYTESFRFPSTDNITLSGGPSGATINNPGVGASLLSANGWDLDRVSCSSISKGDTTLSVDDASAFSPGDDIRIHDPDEMYKGITESDLRNTYNQRKGEFRIVDSVDTASDTITLTSGTHQHYDNPTGELEVAVIDWAITGLHIHNVTIDGGISNPSDNSSNNLRGMSLNECKDVWVTNVESRNWNKDGWTMDESLNYYVSDCHVENCDRYGIGISGGTTHTRVQNVTGNNAGRYMIQSGGGSTSWSDVSRPTYDVIARNCHSENNDYLGDAHFGCENIEYRDCSSDNANTMKIRGFDQHIIGGEYHVSGTAVQSTQIARNSSLEEVYIEGGSRGWNIWPKEGKEFQNLLVKDCQFENMSATLFRFREDKNNNPANVSNLQVVNSSWNGEWIDDRMIENSDGTFSSETIDYSTESPSNQTPAEYFG